MVSQTFGQCPGGGNYAPCTCSGSAASPTVQCLQQPFSTVASIFASNPASSVAINFDLRPDASETSEVPSNIMAGKFFANLNIRCPSTSYALRINANAFSSSASTATKVTLAYCDLSATSLDFIANFGQLTDLELTASVNLNVILPTLRPQGLSSLTRLSLYNSRGLNSWSSTPATLARGLLELDVGANLLSNSGANSLLRWIASSSASTLKTLYMDSNSLTSPPTQIPSMMALDYLDLSYNVIDTIESGALQFNIPVRTLLLSGNEISAIGHAAFIGNFTGARVVMQFNKITQFESQVFEIMINQMLLQGASGSLSVSGSEFFL